MAAKGAVTVLRTSLAQGNGNESWAMEGPEPIQAMEVGTQVTCYVLPQDRQEAAPGIHNVHIEDLNLGAEGRRKAALKCWWFLLIANWQHN